MTLKETFNASPKDQKMIDLDNKEFPQMLSKLLSPHAIQNVYENFGRKGLGPVGSKNAMKSLLVPLNKNADFQGIYMYWFDGEPFYTGTSSTVIKHVNSHVKESDHFLKSLNKSLHKIFDIEMNQPNDNQELKVNEKRKSRAMRKILREDCQVSMLAINDLERLSQFETYLKTKLNID